MYHYEIIIIIYHPLFNINSLIWQVAIFYKMKKKFLIKYTGIRSLFVIEPWKLTRTVEQIDWHNLSV